MAPSLFIKISLSSVLNVFILSASACVAQKKHESSPKLIKEIAGRKEVDEYFESLLVFSGRSHPCHASFIELCARFLQLLLKRSIERFFCTVGKPSA